MPSPPFADENSLAAQPFFREIGYSSCWEDPVVLRQALAVRSGDCVLSIASGGCNVLSLLLDDPASILCVDLNPHQLTLLRLKIAAIRQLEYSELLELLGVRVSSRRIELLDTLFPELPLADREYWRARRRQIAQGLYRTGRTDRYLMAFGTLVRTLFGQSKVKQFFGFAELDAQIEFYRSHWDGWRWRKLFEVFFHRQIISRAKDPSHFRYVEFDRFGERIYARVERLFTTGLVRENYFLGLIMLGHYASETALPPYLLENNLPLVRARLDRLILRHASLSAVLEPVGPARFDAFNLSNLYDWLSDDARIASLRQASMAATPGARWCYWSTLEPRLAPVLEGVDLQPERSCELAYADRFPYAHFETGTFFAQ